MTEPSGFACRGLVCTGAPSGSVVGHRVLLARNLKAVRTAAGLFQEELGARVGLHRTEVTLFERGKRDPRLGTIVKLAGGLGVEPDELLRKSESCRSIRESVLHAAALAPFRG